MKNLTLLVLILLAAANPVGADTIILAGERVLDVEIIRLQGDTLVYKFDDNEWQTNIIEVKSFIIKPDPEVQNEIKVLKRKLKENNLVISKAQGDLSIFKEEINRLRKENLGLRAGKSIIDSPTKTRSSIEDYLTPKILEELKKMYEEEKKANKPVAEIITGQIILTPGVTGVLSVEGSVINPTDRFAAMVTVEVSILDGTGKVIGKEKAFMYNLGKGREEKFQLDFFNVPNWAGADAKIADIIW